MKSKNKKILAVIMAATLFLTSMPELFEKKHQRRKQHGKFWERRICQ